MGYIPNVIARSLVTGRCATVGFIVNDISNPFVAEVVRGAIDTLRSRGYEVLIANSDDDVLRADELMESLLSLKVAGAIVLSRMPQLVVKQASEMLPLVFVSRHPGVDVDFVGVDDEKGAYIAVRHLISVGKSRILFMGGPKDTTPTRKRLSGAKRALAEACLSPEESMIVAYGRFDIDSGKRIFKRMLKSGRGFDGIFAANDLMAIGALIAAYQLGVKIPEEMAIVGFDDIALASYPGIGLTTVHQPKRRLGELAAQMLLERIEGGRSSPKSVCLRPKLIVRATTVNKGKREVFAR
jgi:LacI family transcriptional regulator